MKRKIRTNGDSNIIALTPAAMEQLELKTGDFVDVRVKDKTIVIKKIKGDKNE